MYLYSKCVSISHFMCVSILSNVDETEKQYHVKFYFNFACNGHLNPSVCYYNMSRCWNCKQSRFYKHSGHVTLVKRLKLQKKAVKTWNNITTYITRLTKIQHLLFQGLYILILSYLFIWNFNIIRTSIYFHLLSWPVNRSHSSIDFLFGFMV